MTEFKNVDLVQEEKYGQFQARFSNFSHGIYLEYRINIFGLTENGYFLLNLF